MLEMSAFKLYNGQLMFSTQLINTKLLFMKKHCRKPRQTNFESVHALFAIYTHTSTLHLCYIRINALVFSQSEACNCFMHIIIQSIKGWSWEALTVLSDC